jgi:hypothetical protein
MYGGLAEQPTTIYPVWRGAAVTDPTEEQAAKTQEAQRIKTLTDAGLPLAAVLREVGWDKEKIARALAEKQTADSQAEASMASALLRQARLMDQGQGQPDDGLTVDVEEGAVE